MKMRKFGDWLLGVVMFRGPIATGIGIILEVFFYCIAAFLFGNAKWYQDFTDNHTITFTVVSFIVFHIIGWIIALREWPYIIGDYVDPYAPVPSKEFSFEKDGYTITGKIYKN